MFVDLCWRDTLDEFSAIFYVGKTTFCNFLFAFLNIQLVQKGGLPEEKKEFILQKHFFLLRVDLCWQEGQKY